MANDDGYSLSANFSINLGSRLEAARQGGGALLRRRFRDDPLTLVLVRREGRAAEQDLSAFLPCADAPVSRRGGALHQSFASLDDARHFCVLDAAARSSRRAKSKAVWFTLSLRACGSILREMPKTFRGLARCRIGNGASLRNGCAGAFPRRSRRGTRRRRVSGASGLRQCGQRIRKMKTLSIIVASSLGGILLFLLASASANTALFARHYPGCS